MNARDLYTQNETVSSLIEAVCVRPAMYTMDGTWEESIAFIQGFLSGMAAHNVSEGALKQVAQWNHFCQWACAKFDTSGDWYALGRAIRLVHSEDNSAFAQLAALCLEYKHENELR